VARRVKAKQGFTAWAMVVYAFLYLPILIMVIFAFNKPSAPALTAYHGSNVCNITQRAIALDFRHRSLRLQASPALA